MTFFPQRTLLAAGAVAVGLLGAAPLARGAAATDEVTRWNVLATSAAAAAETDPLTESRVFAILQLAVHDAVNAIVRRYQPLAFTETPSADASVDAAVAAAAHEVLCALMPKASAAFQAPYDAAIAAVSSTTARDAGIALGRRAARAVLAARVDDGADRPVMYEPRDVAGDYRPTPPDFTPAAFAHWGAVTPFALTSSSQFRPVPPPAPNSRQARSEVAEIRRLGGVDSPARTAEQSVIAKYWYENSTQGWNRIARAIADERRMDAWERARFFALVNVAMADGFIAGFEAKYYYRYWRPATAIRASGDATWMNFLPTPPVPDHPSTHTVLGAAAARAMARMLGTDLVSFSMESGAPYAGLRRQFSSLSSAARENGASRLLAGIHFRSAVDAGYTLGEQVGDYAVDTLLLPVQPVSDSNQ